MRLVDISFQQKDQIPTNKLNYQQKVLCGHGLFRGLCLKTPYIGTDNPEDFEPYPVGYIELPGQIMVESRLTGVKAGDLKIGMEMELSIEPFVKNKDGEELMMFSFKPSKDL